MNMYNKVLFLKYVQLVELGVCKECKGLIHVDATEWVSKLFLQNVKTNCLTLIFTMYIEVGAKCAFGHKLLIVLKKLFEEHGKGVK